MAEQELCARCLLGPWMRLVAPPLSQSLFIYFLIVVFIAARVFSSCGKQGLLSSCGGFCRCGQWALGCVGFRSCSSQALKHRLSSCGIRA